jgi:3-hydroxyisobutyrate dehydrogenase-like beta-hydroxyacid dehydrogenase
MPDAKPAICFIGFGEAGQAIAAGLRDAGIDRMSAWDILFARRDGEMLRHAAEASGVRCGSSAADATRDADMIVSAVTAASSVDAARSVKAHGAGVPYFLDINSVSPGRKQETAKILEGGARYVDVAVLAPIHPARHQTPMLLAGPHAQDVAPSLAALGMRFTIAGTEIGAAAAIKMVRSVMIKGIEALTLECFLAAARAGVVDEVASSIKNNYPGLDWTKIVPYNLERMANHGERRAAEMEEVADTLRELGVEPLMTTATVKRQREMGQIGKQQSVRGMLDKDRAAMLGAISAAARDRH